MRFSVKNFLSKSLMENFIFCAVFITVICVRYDSEFKKVLEAYSAKRFDDQICNNFLTRIRRLLQKISEKTWSVFLNGVFSFFVAYNLFPSCNYLCSLPTFSFPHSRVGEISKYFFFNYLKFIGMEAFTLLNVKSLSCRKRLLNSSVCNICRNIRVVFMYWGV